MHIKLGIILTFTILLVSCGGGGGDSDSKDTAELQWQELNHREDDHHMYVALDNSAAGLTSEQALAENASSTTLRQTTNRSVIDPALMANFTEYPGKVVDTRGIGSATIVNFNSTNSLDRCLEHCANWKDCGSVVITNDKITVTCAFHGPTIADSKFYPGTLPEIQTTNTYVFDKRTQPVPYYTDYGDSYYTGNKDGDGSSGPVYVKALFTDKTASDWQTLNNLSKGGSGGEGFDIPDKIVEAIVLTSKTNDSWSPFMYQFLHNPNAELNEGRPFVYAFIYEHFLLKQSCGNSPIGGCANSLVLPATSNGDGDSVSLEDADEFRQKYLW